MNSREYTISLNRLLRTQTCRDLPHEVSVMCAQGYTAALTMESHIVEPSVDLCLQDRANQRYLVLFKGTGRIDIEQRELQSFIALCIQHVDKLQQAVEREVGDAIEGNGVEMT